MQPRIVSDLGDDLTDHILDASGRWPNKAMNDFQGFSKRRQTVSGGLTRMIRDFGDGDLYRDIFFGLFANRWKAGSESFI